MRALFLIHGFMTDERDFTNLIPYLAEFYDKIFLFHIPGHGPNEDTKFFEENITFDNMLAEFDNLNKKYDKIDVVGFSMGGALATYLQQVRNVNRLVLLSPANKYFNFELFGTRLKYYTKNALTSYFLRHKTQEEKEEARKKLEALREDDKRSFKIAFKQLLPNYTPRNINVFKRIIKRCNENLVEITPPTLIIWGQLDQLVPKESVEFDYSICTNEDKKFIDIPSLSHLMLNSVEIDLIVNEIVTFLIK